MEERRVTENIKIEGARLMFRNFQGKASQFNAEGDRNFAVQIDAELAERLKDDGWNVKYLRPRQDDPEQHFQPYLNVKVRYGNIPPIAVLINSRGKKRLTEETIDQLDWTMIKNCDVVIRPYNYPALNGRPAGVSAYLKSIYVTIMEDELDEKYADIPDLDEED